MGAKVGGDTGGPMADLNVTPLIDIVLVLLVVFMVITPLLQSGMPVDLPIATMTKSVNDVGQHIVVSVTYEGGIWVEQTEVDWETCTEEARLRHEDCSLIDLINEEYLINPSRDVLVKADERLEYKEVRKVMDVVASYGMTSMLVAARREE